MAGGPETTVTEILTPILEMEGYELVAVETAGSRHNRTLRLLVHKQGGLSVADCKTVEQSVRPILEVHHILVDYKQFEIASPGVDRPLKTAADFKRNIGRTVHVETAPTNGQASEARGQVVDVLDGCIILEKTSGETVQIEISRVCQGTVQLLW